MKVRYEIDDFIGSFDTKLGIEDVKYIAEEAALYYYHATEYEHWGPECKHIYLYSGDKFLGKFEVCFELEPQFFATEVIEADCNDD